jgi:hypothetical protein
MDGVDLRPAWRGDGAGLRDRALFWHYPHYSNQGGHPGGVVLWRGWKLIENYEQGDVALYRPTRDIGERENLAAAEPARARELRTQLHAWYRDVGARFLEQAPGGPEPWRPRSGPEATPPGTR